MFRQDTFLNGALMAIIISSMTLFILWELDKVMVKHGYLGLRLQFMVVIAIVMNGISFFVFNKSQKDDAMRGVGVVTMIMAIAATIYFMGGKIF